MYFRTNSKNWRRRDPIFPQSPLKQTLSTSCIDDPDVVRPVEHADRALPGRCRPGQEAVGGQLRGHAPAPGDQVQALARRPT